MQEKNSLNSRVSSLETSVMAIKDDLVSLARTVENFANTTHNEIKDLTNAINNTSKTNWGTIISAVGLGILIIGTIIIPIQVRSNANHELVNQRIEHNAAARQIQLDHLREINDLQLQNVQDVSNQRAEYYITEFSNGITNLSEKLDNLSIKVESINARSEIKTLKE